MKTTVRRPGDSDAHTDAYELLLGIQRPEFEVDLSPPCNAEIKNA